MGLISKVRKSMYTSAKVLGDVNAVTTGKVGRRVKNRVTGRIAGKLLSKI